MSGSIVINNEGGVGSHIMSGALHKWAVEWASLLAHYIMSGSIGIIKG